MDKIGLLVLTNPSKINQIVPAIKKHVSKTLYIQYLPGKQHLFSQMSPSATCVPHYGKAVINIYKQTFALTPSVDVRVLLYGLKDSSQFNIKTRNKIEVVIFDRVFSEDDVNKFVNSCLTNVTKKCNIVKLGNFPHEDVKENLISNELANGESNKCYENVVLGGTFDRLHEGHKILLSEAILRCKKKLTIGVTDTSMLLSKTLWELIEPCHKRMSLVRDFVEDIDHTIDYHIVAIDDPFGPTKTDASLQMIVVSAETYRGGEKVNEIRCENNLPPLDIHSVELLEGEYVLEDEEEKKISSSNRRLRLLGTRLRDVQPSPHLSNYPYIIGLTGGIASGKSSVSQKIANLGAGMVNCDILAHNIYAKGEKCYHEVIKSFGKEILGMDGQIDRKKLGNIVFNDKSKLECLNKIIWPNLLEKTLLEVDALFNAGKRVVVIDAAILLQAGWQDRCHEIWSCIVPPQEAVKRLRERNNLTEEEATQRLSALPTNSEFVAQSHIVFCTLWHPEFTQRQVERAWNILKETVEI